MDTYPIFFANLRKVYFVKFCSAFWSKTAKLDFALVKVIQICFWSPCKNVPYSQTAIFGSACPFVSRCLTWSHVAHDFTYRCPTIPYISSSNVLMMSGKIFVRIFFKKMFLPISKDFCEKNHVTLDSTQIVEICRFLDLLMENCLHTLTEVSVKFFRESGNVTSNLLFNSAGHWPLC